jgi:hypothetical protein
MIYAHGDWVGVQCSDVWHKGANHDPNVLALTNADKHLLRELDILLPEDEHAIQR